MEVRGCQSGQGFGQAAQEAEAKVIAKRILLLLNPFDWELVPYSHPCDPGHVFFSWLCFTIKIEKVAVK